MSHKLIFLCKIHINFLNNQESGYAAYRIATESSHFSSKSIEDINPLEEWPKDIILFIRVSSLIHGICIELNETIPFLKILAKRAQQYLYNESFKTAISTISNNDNKNKYENSSMNYLTAKTKYNKKIEDYVSRLVENNRVLGIQISVIKNGKLLSSVSKGKMGELDCRDITHDSLFNGFFINIGILVVGILLCVDRGYIELDDPICNYWDGFVRYGKRNITLRHILTHRSGLHSFFSENFSLLTLFSYENVIKIIEDSTPEYPLDSKTVYNPFLLGWILSELISLVTNQPTPDFINNNLFVPFDLQNDMMIYIPNEKNMNENTFQKCSIIDDKDEIDKESKSKSNTIFELLSSQKKKKFSFFSPIRLNMLMGFSNDNDDFEEEFTDKSINFENNCDIKETTKTNDEECVSDDEIKHRITKVSRKIEFSSISHEAVLKKFESTTNYIKSKSESKNSNKYSGKQKKSTRLNSKKNERLTTFQLFKSKPYVLDPLIYNSKKVLNMWIPPTNGKYNSLSLSKFYYYFGSGKIISNELVQDSLKILASDNTLEGLILTSGISRRWSLGFQVLECEYNPSKIDIYYNCIYNSNKSTHDCLKSGKTYHGIGHSDIGGNLSFVFPELNLSFSILSNDYIKGSYVSRILVNYILRSFGLVLKNYVPIRL